MTDDPAALFLERATRPVIVSDIDGVLAFLTETIVTALNAHFGLSIVVSEMTNYWIEDTLRPEQRAWLVHQFNRGVFYENAAPDYSALAALNAVHADGYHVIVSSDRPPGTTKDATDRWLAKWRVAHDEVQLLGKGGKRKLLQSYGPSQPAILIDDDPAKALTVARDGVEVWSPQRPWTPIDWQNYPHYWVFDSWQDALDRLGIDGDVPIPQFSRDAGPADQPQGEPASTHSEAV